MSGPQFHIGENKRRKVIVEIQGLTADVERNKKEKVPLWINEGKTTFNTPRIKLKK